MAKIDRSFIITEEEKPFGEVITVHRKIHRTEKGEFFEEKTGKSAGSLKKIPEDEAIKLIEENQIY